ncbi:MAG: hypothetical protein CNLJKLNK_01049 [Holosporales bacterium]
MKKILKAALAIFVFASSITVNAASRNSVNDILRRIENNPDQALMDLLTANPQEPTVEQAEDQYWANKARKSRSVPPQQAWNLNPYNLNRQAPLNNNPTIDNLMRNANNGNVDAAYSLGAMYFHGKGVQQNYQLAFKYFSQAANMKEPRSINELGLMYYNGLGVQEDFEKAYSNFKKAAKLGNKTAHSNVALCFLHGKGVTQNVQKAINIYQELTSQGYADAAFHLAMIHQTETYHQMDAEKARDFMNKALDMKSVKAENYLKNNPDFFRKLQISNSSVQAPYSRSQSLYSSDQDPYSRSQTYNSVQLPAYGSRNQPPSYAATPPASGRRSQNFYSAR